MKCPFLNETQVRFCRHSIYRKMIVREMDYVPDEKCSSSSRYPECAVFNDHRLEEPVGPHCPFLEESLMQYCSAAAVPKFVPYSDSMLTRCTTDGFRYCDAYVALATAGRSAWPGAAPGGQEFAGPVHVPLWLYYAPNHMWLDISDGVCHVGIDAFLARVIGRADRVRFISTKDVCRPAAVLTIGGIGLQITFPTAISITEVNVHLHAEPLRLTTDPYRLGWMFRGHPADRPAHSAGSALTSGLRTGEQAAEWMRAEVDRMTRFVQDVSPSPGPTPILNDGGVFDQNIVRRMAPAQARLLFDSFFSDGRAPT